MQLNMQKSNAYNISEIYNNNNESKSILVKQKLDDIFQTDKTDNDFTALSHIEKKDEDKNFKFI